MINTPNSNELIAATNTWLFLKPMCASAYGFKSNIKNNS